MKQGINLTKIKNRIDKIESLKHDPEVAHELEDKLFYDFVKAIKNDEFCSYEDIKYLSEAILKFKDIQFPRWTA